MALTVPKFINKAFAAVGIKNNIPDASNNVTGRAGYDQGFPAINMQPIEAGGIPPDGGDMNGVLYDISSVAQYYQSGVYFPFDQSFATAIGGYPINAVVSDATAMWVNSTSNNTSFPAGWTQFIIGDPTESVRGTPLVANISEVINGYTDKKMVTPYKMRLGVAYSLSINGYISFPTWLSGLIIQWGTVTTVPNTTTTYTFPVRFPNLCFAVLASFGIPAAGTVNASPLSTSQFRLQNNGATESQAATWYSIGF